MSARVSLFASAALAVGLWNVLSTAASLLLSLWLPLAILVAALHQGSTHGLWRAALLLVAFPLLRVPTVFTRLLSINESAQQLDIQLQMLRRGDSDQCWNLAGLYTQLVVALVVLQAAFRWYVGGQADVFAPPTAWKVLSGSLASLRPHASGWRRLTAAVHPTLITAIEDTLRAALLLAPIVIGVTEVSAWSMWRAWSLAGLAGHAAFAGFHAILPLSRIEHAVQYAVGALSYAEVLLVGKVVATVWRLCMAAVTRALAAIASATGAYTPPSLLWKYVDLEASASLLPWLSLYASTIIQSLLPTLAVAGIVAICIHWETALTLLNVTRKLITTAEVLSGMPLGTIQPAYFDPMKGESTIHADIADLETFPGGPQHVSITSLDVKVTALSLVAPRSVAAYMLTFPRGPQENIRTQSVTAKRPSALTASGSQAIVYQRPLWRIVADYHAAKARAFGQSNVQSVADVSYDGSLWGTFMTSMAALITSFFRIAMAICRVRSVVTSLAGTIAKRGSSEAVLTEVNRAGLSGTSGAELHSPVSLNIIDDLVQQPAMYAVAVGPTPPLPTTRLATPWLHSQQHLLSQWQARLMCAEFAVCCGDASITPSAYPSATSGIIDETQHLISSLSISTGSANAEALHATRILRAVEERIGPKQSATHGVPSLSRELLASMSAIMAPKNALIVALRDAVLRPSLPGVGRGTSLQSTSTVATEGSLAPYSASPDFVVMGRSKAHRPDAVQDKSIVDELVNPVVIEVAAWLCKNPTQLDSAGSAITPSAAASPLHKALRTLRGTLVKACVLPPSRRATAALANTLGAERTDSAATEPVRSFGEASLNASIRRRRRSTVGSPVPRQLVGLRTENILPGPHQLYATSVPPNLSASTPQASGNDAVTDAFMMSAIASTQPSLTPEASSVFAKVVAPPPAIPSLTAKELNLLFVDSSGAKWQDLMWTCTALVDSMTVSLSIASSGPKRPASVMNADKFLSQLEGSANQSQKAVATATEVQVDVFSKRAAGPPSAKPADPPTAVTIGTGIATKLRVVLWPFAAAWLNLVRALLWEPVLYLYTKAQEHYELQYAPRVAAHFEAFREQMQPYNAYSESVRWFSSTTEEIANNAASSQAPAAVARQFLELCNKLQITVWDICGASAMDARTAQPICDRIETILRPPQSMKGLATDANTGRCVLKMTARASEPRISQSDLVGGDITVPVVRFDALTIDTSSSYLRRIHVPAAAARYAAAVSVLFVLLPATAVSYARLGFPVLTSCIAAGAIAFFAYVALAAKSAVPFRVAIHAADDLHVLIELVDICVANGWNAIPRVQIVDGIPYWRRVIGLLSQKLISTVEVMLVTCWTFTITVLSLVTAAVTLAVLPLIRALFLDDLALIRRVILYGSDMLRKSVAPYALYIPLLPFRATAALCSFAVSVLRDVVSKVASWCGRKIEFTQSGAPSGDLPHVSLFEPNSPSLALCVRSPADSTASIMADHRAIEAAVDMIATVIAESKTADMHGMVQRTMPVVIASLSACLSSLAMYMSSPRYVSAFVRKDDMGYSNIFMTSKAWGDSSATMLVDSMCGSVGATGDAAFLVHEGLLGTTHPMAHHTRPAVASLQAALVNGLNRIARAFPTYYDEAINNLPSPILTVTARAAIISTE